MGVTGAPDTNRSAGLHSFAVVGFRCRRARVIEFAGCRSDLWWVSANAFSSEKRLQSSRRGALALARRDGHVIGVERRAAGEYRPDNARILVGQRDHRLLPAHALLQLNQPLASDRSSSGESNDR